MVLIKVDEKYYVAYKNKEVGNPHEKGYPCLVDLENKGIIPTGSQRSILKKFFTDNNLDYHEVISYKEKDINTHDLVTAVIKFHDMKRI